MKGIRCCGECANYSYKKHACTICTDEGKPTDSFYTDCPLPDVVELPCKIGDEVWAIKNFSGVKHPKKGIVSEMFFRQNMKLVIVVSHVARGLWMETIFPTYEDAVAAIKRKGNEDAVD